MSNIFLIVNKSWGENIKPIISSHVSGLQQSPDSLASPAYAGGRHISWSSSILVSQSTKPARSAASIYSCSSISPPITLDFDAEAASY